MSESVSYWERPFTTRRYLNGPMSQNMFTLWADAKIMCGEIEPRYDLATIHQSPSSAIWLLQGERAKRFDYKKVKHLKTDDGVPIHGAFYATGDITVQLECICNIRLIPTCFSKITVKNTVPWTAHEKLWLMVRTAPSI